MVAQRKDSRDGCNAVPQKPDSVTNVKVEFGEDEVKRSLGLTRYNAPNAVEELKQLRKHTPKEKMKTNDYSAEYIQKKY